MAERSAQTWLRRNLPALAAIAAWAFAVNQLQAINDSETAQAWLAAIFTVTLGYALGRFKVLFLPIVLGGWLLLSGYASGEVEPWLETFWVAFLAACALGCLLLGVIASKLIRSRRANRIWAGVLLSEAALLLVLATPMGDVHPSVRHHGKGTRIARAQGPVDEVAGTYAGIPLGYPRESVKRKHGWPLLTISTPVMDKTNEPFYDPETDRTLGTPDNELKYRDARFDFNGGRAVRIMVYGRGAHTSLGVGIGDPLHKAKQVYGARCWPERQIGSRVIKARCDVRLSSDRYLYFGENPIRLIGIATHDFGDSPY